MLLRNISTGLGLFWDDFFKKIRDTHPHTSILNSNFLIFYFAKLLMRVIKREIHNVNFSLSAEPTFEVNRKHPKRPVNVNVTEGDNYSFICDPNAEPTAEITWYRNGEELNGKLASQSTNDECAQEAVDVILKSLFSLCPHGSQTFFVISYLSYLKCLYLGINAKKNVGAYWTYFPDFFLGIPSLLNVGHAKPLAQCRQKFT